MIKFIVKRRVGFIFMYAIFIFHVFIYEDVSADFLSDSIKSLHGRGLTTTHHTLFSTNHVQTVTYHKYYILIYIYTIIRCVINLHFYFFLFHYNKI